MLEVLVTKTETIKKELGSLAKVIDDDVERRLRNGIRHREVDDPRREIEAADLDEAKKQTAAEELEDARSAGSTRSSPTGAAMRRSGRPRLPVGRSPTDAGIDSPSRRMYDDVTMTVTDHEDPVRCLPHGRLECRRQTK